MDKIREMIRKKERRLSVSINDLRAHSPRLAKFVLTSPGKYLYLFETALSEIVAKEAPSYVSADAPVRIGFEGSFGLHHVTPRGLSASLLHKMVMLEGIVTKVSLVRPKVVKSVHYCPATNEFSSRQYRDATDPYDMPTSSVYPTKDERGNPLETEYGLSDYRDFQTLGIQEMPERAPAGQLPRSVTVVLNGDLVDAAKPGDRINIVGIYQALAGRASGSMSGVFKTAIIANSVGKMGKDALQPVMTEDDIANIKALAAEEDVYSKLASSLAPSIYGHGYIKKALLLLLLGGVEHNLDSGTHIRGDINILMVGDPSTAKSQMLRFAMTIAPLAISTTGRGSSGVGLTAAVTTDSDTGDRRLEAGAMVLADRGIVCIDEFDKMSDTDRVAIHEVMEQQTVTIAKAGIHTSLNARCSVLAAANPIYGQYNSSIPPQRNINLPDSLLSRFDLLFIVLDTKDPARDRDIAVHVLRSHRYRNPNASSLGYGSNPNETVVEEDVEDEETVGKDATTPMFEKFDRHLHADRIANTLLSVPFLKKYIHYAKSRIEPVLRKEIVDYIASAYAELRSKEDNKTLPVTARTLETIIRLSSAHAKARLSQVVEQEDAVAALELLNFALYKDATVVAPAARTRRIVDNDDEEDDEDLDDTLFGGGEDDDNDNDDDDEDGGSGSRRSQRKKRAEIMKKSQESKKTKKGSATGGNDKGKEEDEFAFSMSESDDDETGTTTSTTSSVTRNILSRARKVDAEIRAETRAKAKAQAGPTFAELLADDVPPASVVNAITDNNVRAFRKTVNALLSESSSMTLEAIHAAVNKQGGASITFTTTQTYALVLELQDEDRVMINGHDVILV